jgi:cell division protein FtsI/penicillin-binding protein 2
LCDRTFDAQEVVDAALESSELPAAAVLLAVPETRVLALGNHRGADPVKLLVRPGSTVKPILAWLAAEARLIEAGEAYRCDGTYPGGFRCYDVHGSLRSSDALAVSCNVYGCELAHRLGLARIARGFSDFGLLQPTGLFAGEARGWMADPAWVASRGVSEHRPAGHR